MRTLHSAYSVGLVLTVLGVAVPAQAQAPAGSAKAAQPADATGGKAGDPKPAKKKKKPADAAQPTAPKSGQGGATGAGATGAGATGAGAAGAGAAGAPAAAGDAGTGDAPLLPPDTTTGPKTTVAGDATTAGDATGEAEAKAEEARKAEEAKKAEDAKKAEEAKKAAEAQKAEDDKSAAARKKAGSGTEDDNHVFAEDWWGNARPSFEIHGYYRVRTEFMANFALGRRDTPANTLWPQPADNDYIDSSGVHNNVSLCGDTPTAKEPCENNIQAGANMRFRLSPELHISDNVRIMAQIDLLDNVVLGSTPEGYSNQPGDSGGYSVRQRGGYTPVGAFSSTQWAPVAGQNSFTDSIAVKRVWGEYMTPIGLLRFGRMPSSWGLGMFVNAGDGYDSDWGSTADRIMFVTGIKSWDLYFAGLWDFANEGATSALVNERGGQPYDLSQSDDVNQWGLVIVRKRDADLAKTDLAHGLPVVNGGLYAVYRQQTLDSESALGSTSRQVASNLQYRGAQAFIPDFWFQFMWDKFRFESEAAMVWGGIQNTDFRFGNNYKNPDDASGDNDGWNIRQFGFTVQSELKLLDDKLRIQLGGGYATGDDDVEGLAPPSEGFDAQLTHNRTFSTFRFHPDYRVDLILFRNILQRIQGAYYFRPSVEYDFQREPNGQKIGGGAAVIWSRASEPVQTPGNASDLGVELNFKIYYQAKDGALNDDLDKMGGFFTQIEYGVMFPLGGLGYLPGEEQNFEDLGTPIDTSTAQTVRWYLGILF